jgi:hypothetical protein
MTAMKIPISRRQAIPARRLVVLSALIAAGLLGAGCSTGPPGEISRGNLAEAQTFPYFKVYWVGSSFEARPLAAVDGLRGYIPSVGDGIYYGDCVQKKGIFGGGSCELPLQVTTVLYHLHSNKALGPQRNIVLRGVPATVYDEGRSIEIYAGRVAIDIFSDTYAHAMSAARRVFPVNAPGSSSASLPSPVYCPGLYGPTEAAVERVMEDLPGRSCQRARATLAYSRAVSGD